MTVSAFLTGICSLISGVFSAVFAQSLLAFFMTATLLAVVSRSVSIYLPQVETILK